jgi:hypothetical protein
MDRRFANARRQEPIVSLSLIQRQCATPLRVAQPKTLAETAVEMREAARTRGPQVEKVQSPTEPVRYPTGEIVGQ